jgi:hypothetical protein
MATMERITTAKRLADFHLSPAEVACTCCGRIDLALPVAQLFAAVRAKVGAHDVASGCRCPRRILQLIADPAVHTKAGSVLAAAHASLLPADGYGVSRPCTAIDPRVPAGMSRKEYSKIVSATAKGLFGEDARIGTGYPDGYPIHFDLFPYVLRVMGLPNPDPVNVVPWARW